MAASPVGAIIPLEQLARAPQTSSPAIAPDGDRLALIEMVDGRGMITVRDLASGQSRRLYRDAERSLSNVRWSADGRWLLFLQDAGGDEGYHLYRLDPDAAEPAPRDLTPFAGIEVEIVKLPRGDTGAAIVTLNRRDPEHADAYRIDLHTGALTELARNSGGFTGYHADDAGRVVAATAIGDGGSLDLLARDEGGGWRGVYRAPPDERFSVLAISPDGAVAYVLGNRDAPAERIARLNLRSGALEPVEGRNCGRFDDGGIVADDEGRVRFRVCVAEQAGLVPIDEHANGILDAVRAIAGPEAAIALESHAPDLTAMIFYSDRSDRPGRFILYRDGAASVLAELRPWLAGHRFSPSEPIWIEARDGLPLLIYLTRPLGKSEGPLPMVVALHGGPWSRDAGGFEETTQLLANRGYAVLQVNFRGSTGLGKAVFEGGVGEFAGAMSDDVLDALDWAIMREIADPERVCVMGGSYGGYATLVAMTRDAGRFRCGIDFAGPADLVTLMEAFPPSWQAFLPRSWYRFVGNPSDPAQRAAMAARSPLGKADAISGPMLIFQGANDPRVTQAQSDAIVCALRGRGIAADYLLAGNEGHSFGNEETSLAVNRAAEQFLGAQLGGWIQPTADSRIEQALAALRDAGEAIACSDR